MTNCQSKPTKNNEQVKEGEEEDLQMDCLFDYLDAQACEAQTTLAELMAERGAEKGAFEFAMNAFAHASALFDAWRDCQFNKTIIISYDIKDGYEKIFEEFDDLFSEIRSCMRCLCPRSSMFIKLFGENVLQRYIELREKTVVVVVFMGTNREARKLQRNTEWKLKPLNGITITVGGPTHLCRTCKKDEDKMTKCSGCNYVRYCSRACQKVHWKESHKTDCSVIKGHIASSWVSVMKD